MSLQNKRRGLGRGLDAILQSPETDITSSDISGNYVAGANIAGFTKVANAMLWQGIC